MRQDRVDVVILGAGVAGLTCAQKLQQSGLRILVLEARDRLGGRIWTQPSILSKSPVELGAEFVHGEAVEVFKRARDLGLSYVEVTDCHHRPGKKGLISKPDFFEQIGGSMDRLNPDRKKDRSFQDFLDASRTIKGRRRSDLKAYIEGFHAAEASVISEKNLAKAEQGGDKEDDKSYRLIGGYGSLLQGFVQGFEARSEILRLKTVVKEILWKKHSVEIRTQSESDSHSYFAKQVVIALPAGVLQAKQGHPSFVRLSPEPPGYQDQLSSVRMGGVIRLTFEFRNRFWSDLADQTISFLHNAGSEYFPTWWTQAPIHSPHLTAWQGGPKAWELSGKSAEERNLLAITSLSDILKVPVSEIQNHLVNVAFHDWNEDPYSLGAYSYVVVGGHEKLKMWTKPVADTLYFAGEATYDGDARGTVHGAISSGLRAAEQILRTRMKRSSDEISRSGRSRTSDRTKEIILSS